MGWLVIIVLLVLVVGTMPQWPYSRKWGYGPGGILSVVLVIMLLLLIFNVLPRRF